MKLTTATVLEGVATALREQVSPALEDDFAIDVVRLAQTLVTIAARAGDDAVVVRVEENARMRALLGEGGALLGDAAFTTASRSADPGLRISELDAETGRLRALLVDLHGRLEDEPQAEARALDQAIWRALRDAEMARAPRG